MLDANVAVLGLRAPASVGLMPLRSLAFRAFGTSCEIRYLAPWGDAAVEFERVTGQWVADFEARYSRFRTGSVVARINAAAGPAWIEVDAEMELLLDRCAVAYGLSGGVLDATASPLQELWDDGRTQLTVPEMAAIARARALVGWPKVQRAFGRIRLPRPGMVLDFGGWGDAWAVDAVINFARNHGIKHAMVNFGRNIRCLGTPLGRPAWHIGLENPAWPDSHQGSVSLPPGMAISSCCSCLRGFAAQGRRDGPMVDPRSGVMVTHGVRQVAVVAEDSFQASLLAATAFVLGPVGGRDFVERFKGADALIVTETQRIETRGFWSHVVS